MANILVLSCVLRVETRSCGWAFLVESLKEPHKKSDDLTRRGGVTLDEEAKSLLESMVKDCGDWIRLAVRGMPASGITKVRIFDQKNLNLPYSNGRVALYLETQLIHNLQ